MPHTCFPHTCRSRARRDFETVHGEAIRKAEYDAAVDHLYRRSSGMSVQRIVRAVWDYRMWILYRNDPRLRGKRLPTAINAIYLVAYCRAPFRYDASSFTQMYWERSVNHAENSTVSIFAVLACREMSTAAWPGSAVFMDPDVFPLVVMDSIRAEYAREFGEYIEIDDDDMWVEYADDPDILDGECPQLSDGGESSSGGEDDPPEYVGGGRGPPVRIRNI